MPITRSTRRLLCGALLVPLLALTACGDDDDEDADTSDTTAVPSGQTSDGTTTTGGGATTTEGGEAAEFDVTLAETDLGEVLVDADGMTLYVFAEDEERVSNCNDACADGWPPLEPATGVADEGVTGELIVITREDGSSQLTIAGHPLYLFAGDAAPGETNGHGVGGVWAAVGADGEALPADGAEGESDDTTTTAANSMDY